MNSVGLTMLLFSALLHKRIARDLKRCKGTEWEMIGVMALKCIKEVAGTEGTVYV